MTTAYPLHWPEGWPRTPAGERSAGHQFKQAKWQSSQHHPSGGYMSRGAVTFAKARDQLYAELERLGARSAVISTNHPADVRGLPIESKRKVEDDAVAVYFQYRDRPMVMACDRFDNAAANMRSLGLAIEAMRQLERHGGGTMMEKAFAGFSALPPPKSCWAVLGIAPRSTEVEIRRAWRDKMKEAHPDRDGSDAAAAELNSARDQALREIAA